MKVVGALVAGLVLALAPTGAAFAGEAPNGKAFGNCGISSAGGGVEHTGLAGNGHGGMVKVAKADKCDAGQDHTPPVKDEVYGPPTGVISEG